MNDWGYQAEVLADSINASGARLTTMQVTFPRIILAEFNTHRVLSRNSASSRAVPVKKRIAMVEKRPFVPEVFYRNKAGMQGDEPLTGEDEVLAREAWHVGAMRAAEIATLLNSIGVHKQTANRVLEPYLWHTVVVSATEWDNFFHLRCNPDAQPEFRKIACMMREARDKSEPVMRAYGDWHLPYITDEERATHGDQYMYKLAKISSARCARVSYKAFDGTTSAEVDIALGHKLMSSGHMSPFEHAARSMGTRDFRGNFSGWLQYRKMLPHEYDPLGHMK